MSNTIPEQLRPRRQKKKFKFRFVHFTIILIAAAISGILLFSTNAAKVEQEQAANRTTYKLGAILEINFSAEDLTSNLQDLTAKLDLIKNAGFDTILLPPLQTGQDVEIGEKTFRAVSDWLSIDEAYGDENQLKALIEKAENNDQQILMTLPTGLLSTSNPWATEHPNWLLSPKQKEGFFAQSGITKDVSEALEVVGGPAFLSKAYVEIINYWADKYDFKGVQVAELPNGSSALNERALEMLRTEKHKSNGFVSISSRSQVAGRMNSGFSATATEDVSKILSSIQSQFDPDSLALAVDNAIQYKAGPTIIHSNVDSNPSYFTAAAGNETQLNLSTALAYALPGVPKIQSKQLASPSALKLFKDLNQTFSTFQQTDSADAANSVQFFIASEDGTAGFAIKRNGKSSIIFVNANSSEKIDASFTVPQQFRGTYQEMASGLSFKVEEEFLVNLNQSSIRLFTKE